MTPSEIMQLIGLSISAFGFGFTIYQIIKSNWAKKYDIISSIHEKLRNELKISRAIYLIDYSESWLNEEFFSCSSTEKEIDSYLSLLNFICFLRKKRYFSKNDMCFFSYFLVRVIEDYQCRAYLWNLYHFSKRRCNGKNLFNYLIEYMILQFTKKEKNKFLSRISSESGYIQYLNF